MVRGSSLRQTRASKRGEDYCAVNAAMMSNKRDVDSVATCESGMPIKLTYQVGGGVKKLLV